MHGRTDDGETPPKHDPPTRREGTDIGFHDRRQMVLRPSHHRNKLSCASERIDQERQAPSREVSRIGGLDLCQAKAKTKARHRAIGELSIGRSFKRSEYFQHLSWTAIRRLSNAAILSRPGWHGRRNCPAGPHNWALGRARRCRGDRRDVKGPGISVSNPSHGIVDRDRASPVANSARFVSTP